MTAALSTADPQTPILEFRASRADGFILWAAVRRGHQAGDTPIVVTGADSVETARAEFDHYSSIFALTRGDRAAAIAALLDLRAHTT